MRVNEVSRILDADLRLQAAIDWVCFLGVDHEQFADAVTEYERAVAVRDEVDTFTRGQLVAAWARTELRPFRAA